MTEANEASKNPSFWRGVWLPFLFGVFLGMFSDFLYKPVAWMLAAVATCIDYLIKPRPKVGFLKYFFAIQAVMLVTVITIWLIPQQLEEMIPSFWAYSLPLFLLFTAIYFVPPLEGGKRDTLLWKWILGCVVGASLYGLTMSYL